MMALVKLLILCLLLLPSAKAFQSPSATNHRVTQIFMSSKNDGVGSGRRSFLTLPGLSILAVAVSPQPSIAGIDVSGLRVEGQTGGAPDIASQLKAYDGSGATRVRVPGSDGAADSDVSSAATWAYRASVFNPNLSRAGPIGTLYRYDDQIVGPTQASRPLSVSFEFPSDWLQLDKATGGIQYVDQRNGDKLYVLRAKLPPDTTLATVPKTFFGDAIFDPQGSISRTGTVVDEYKVMSSTITSDCPEGTCATRRRLKIKYFTVTGNGLRVERRALVDAYEVKPDYVYMIMTSSNANKFEAKGAERDTVEHIVDTFRVE